MKQFPKSYAFAISGLIAGNLVINSTAFAAPVCDFDSCHMVRSPVQEVEAKLDFDICPTETEEITHWVVYASDVPNLERQLNTKTTLEALGGQTGKRTKELSALGREVLKLDIASDKRFLHKLPVRAIICTRLYQTRLAPGKAIDVMRLSANEVEANLMPTISLDFQMPTFQDFLNKNSYRRQKDESDLCFAWRIFCALRTRYKYHWQEKMDRKASITCQKDGTDCGGLSYLFCAILRANGIPARPLIGRWAKSSSQEEDYSGSFSCHVKSEFFTALGWVPADLAEAVANKSKRAERYFANDNGDFIVMHANPDLVLESPEGRQEVRSMPDFRYWISARRGSKTLNDRVPRKIVWKVSCHRLD